MGNSYLITGVPGFIGKRLVRRLLPDGRPLYLLCEKRFEQKTRELIDELAAEGGPGKRARELCRVAPGDITLPNLGLEGKQLDEVRAEVSEVYHLAAIYDLAVPEALAHKVNVEGTRNVVVFLESIPGCRHNYVSTCYVAGDREGLVFEDELEKGQGFKNFYESTKHEAERIVRSSTNRIETRILRPSIVIGDSRTGETDKFDGPYVAFRAIAMGLLALLPGAARTPTNLVPVDFVVDAMSIIPKQPGTAGKTFALADSNPMMACDLVAMVADRMRAPRPVGRVPAGLFKAILKQKALSEFLGIPAESIDYFNKYVVFDTTNTRLALEGTGISCPLFPTYANVVLRYWRERAELPWSLAQR